MLNPQYQQRFVAGMAKLGLNFSPEPYLELLALLAKWNRSKNLTSITSVPEMISKHLLDSLSILPYIDGEHILDVGTGPGFPGLPLAISLPDKHFYLCDSNGKKIAFIIDAIRVLKLSNVTLVNKRIEQYACPNSSGFDCIVSRAFANIGDMLELTDHLMGSEGKWLAMKGQLLQDELAMIDASLYQVESHRLDVPYVDAERHAIEIRRLK